MVKQFSLRKARSGLQTLPEPVPTPEPPKAPESPRPTVQSMRNLLDLPEHPPPAFPFRRGEQDRGADTVPNFVTVLCGRYCVGWGSWTGDQREEVVRTVNLRYGPEGINAMEYSEPYDTSPSSLEHTSIDGSVRQVTVGHDSVPGRRILVTWSY